MLRAMPGSGSTHEDTGRQRRRHTTPLSIFVACAAVYVITLGPRVRGPSDNAHYVYLAQSLLHGKLELLAGSPPGTNDWALYGGRWYVSFPPFPAVVIAPAVALWGLAVWDRLFWAIAAGAAPALLYIWLRRLREQGESERSARDDLLLTGLFALGTPYYYTSVQGTVWFAAHVVTCALIALFLLGATRARRPWLAGCALGLAFMTRGPTLVAYAFFFLIQALAQARLPGTDAPSRVRDLWRGLDLRKALALLVKFSIPLLGALAISMWINYARFEDPFEAGHSHLQIRWRGRIETWGLFNYHYLARNLAVLLTSLPWLSSVPPYLKISRHGLALWVTTPQLWLVLWPKRHSLLITSLGIAAALVALGDALYQNSGWIQFAYRFGLDYMPALIGLLALGGHRFGVGFKLLCVYALAINLFGAVTFDRYERFYDNDPTQRVIFQPD